MNAINRRGQKVVCIAELVVTDPAGCPYAGKVPQPDEVCTVQDFVETGRCITPEGGLARCLPGLALVGVPCPLAKDPVTGVRRPMGWPIAAFRPIDQGRTDISDLIEAGRRASKRRTTPAREDA